MAKQKKIAATIVINITLDYDQLEEGQTLEDVKAGLKQDFECLMEDESHMNVILDSFNVDVSVGSLEEI